MKPLQKGDYVLATKWHDGDPQDHFVIGIYDHYRADWDRHIVNDMQGIPFRAGGFRRCEKVSIKRGEWILKNIKDIAIASCSVWHFKNCKMW